jgi:predicted dehydrogenase
MKIAVAGCGGEARFYLHHYTEMPQAEVIIVQDVVEEKARASAAKFGVPKWTTSFEDILQEEVELVDVSTPNHLHGPQTIAALEAGKHVIVQKPMASTVEECQRMIAAANKVGRKLGIFMSALEDTLNHDLKRMVEEKFFGVITSVRSRGAHRGGLFYPPKGEHWRGSVEKTGGGSFMQLAIHSLNLLQWILGVELVRVCAFSKTLLLQDKVEGDDTTHAVAEFANGVLGTFESSWCTDGGALEIYGTEGRLLRHSGELYLESSRTFQGEVIDFVTPGRPIRKSQEELAERIQPLGQKYCQHRAFVSAILNNEEPPVRGEIGLRDVRLVEAVYRSAAEQRVVEVEYL